MTYFDPLFPFSPPSWLFCHTIVIERWSLQQNDSDHEGWPIGTSVTEATVPAYVSPPDPRSLDPAGEAIDTVVHVGKDVTVDHRDRFRVPTGQNLPGQLTGSFRITAVRPNAADIRVLATRVSDPAGAER